MVSVAPHLRGAVGRLPQPVRLDATLPDPGAIPDRRTTAPEARPRGARPGSARSRGPSLRARSRSRISVGEKRPSSTLRRSPVSSAGSSRMLGALFDPSDVTHLLESLAFQSSSLTTLRQITARMLASTDVDEGALPHARRDHLGLRPLVRSRRALHVGRGEERLRWREGDRTLRRRRAHRIWEAIELEGMTIGRLIDDYAERRFDTRFQQRIQSTMLVPGAGDDEVRLALDESETTCASTAPRP